MHLSPLLTQLVASVKKTILKHTNFQGTVFQKSNFARLNIFFALVVSLLVDWSRLGSGLGSKHSSFGSLVANPESSRVESFPANNSIQVESFFTPTRVLPTLAFAFVCN